MKNLITVLLGTLVIFSANSQAFVEDIRVGQKMPAEITIGGYSEEKADNCKCRIFSIRYNVNSWEVGSGGADLAETIGIHFSEGDSVVGIIKIKLRINNEDAQKVYNSRLSEYMRTQSYLTDRKLITARDSNNGVVDGIYYFIYSYDEGTKYRGTGVVEKAIVEETYLPNSSYKPRLVN